MKKIFIVLTLLLLLNGNNILVSANTFDVLGSEVISERTATSKTFNKNDGSFEVAMYDETIHYKDEEGKWIQVNNSLNDNENNVENKNNTFKVKFPKKLDDNKKIELTMSKYSIDWSVLDIDSSPISYSTEEFKVNNIKELVNTTQVVTYMNILNDVDLEYILSGSSIKENIILNEYSENFSLTFEFKLTGLSLLEDEEGNFLFVDNDNIIIFEFSDLFMYDSKYNDSQDIVLTVNETGNKTYDVELIPNNEWLQTATYPVVIDPTIVVTSVTSNIYDTYIYSGAATTNYSSYSYMTIADTSYTYQYKGLIYFSIPSSLMDKTIIYSKLYLTKSVKNIGRQINLYQNTEYFSSASATWANAPDYDNDEVDYHIIGSSDVYEFNITRSVWDWQNSGNTTTTGFTIADSQTFGAYNSVKQMGDPNSTLRPKITIGYFDFGPTISGPGAAREYVELFDPSYPNCYGYAIGRFDENYKIQPGEFSTGGISLASEIVDVDYVAIKVINDFFELGRSIRFIDNYNSLIYSDEYRIALRVKVNVDYHFMVQTSSGQWAHKGGTKESILLNVGDYPEIAYWGAVGYNSEILYFAIKD